MDYQQFINEAVQTVIGILAASAVGALLGMGRKIARWLVSKTSANDRYILHKIADEAVAYAGAVFKEQNGEERLQNALTYVNAHLKPYCISFTEVELRGAIEKAYAAYKAQGQAPVNTVNIQAPKVTSQPNPNIMPLNNTTNI